MLRRLAPFVLLAALFLLAVPSAVYADGIIVPDPPPPGCLPLVSQPEPIPGWLTPVPITICPPRPELAIVYHRVTVTIQDQLAVTRVDQAFRNDSGATVEGMYIFPLPPDSSVTRFSLWVGGEKVDGKVLTAEEARAIYEDIVRRQRDPALLEYIDRSAVQARIFPIAPGETRQIELEYTQTLPMSNGLVHYRYPLNTEKFSSQPLEQVSIAVEARSTQALRAIYSPSHPISVSRDGEHNFHAGYEASGVRPDTDFDLYYSTAQNGIGLNLMTFHDPAGGESDGFFLLLVSPGLETGDAHFAKDVIFVLDRSGSMYGEKFDQAQQAAHYVLEHLNAEDRFGLIAFSTGMEPFASELLPASRRNEAERWLDTLGAEGSTDIHRALLEAAAMVRPGRPTYLIFLTDGLPTEGVINREQILEAFGSAAPSTVRLFAFGVGYDVDTVLLDSLAQAHHGATTYVAPGESIDEAVSAFYARITSPVLTDLKLDFGRITAYDYYPQELPDLFGGSQLVVTGRYRGSGSSTITLSGRVNNEARSFSYPEQSFSASGGLSALSRLWATRKIGHLLNEIRLHGANRELVDTVVALSVRYGIVTPYTSYLVTEPGALSADSRQQITDQALREMQAMPTQVAGAPAVQKAQEQSQLAGAQSVPASSLPEAQDVVRSAGSHSFVLRGDVWIDTTFDAERMQAAPIAFGSNDYFKLAGVSPEVGAALALGRRVVIVWQGKAYEIVAEGETVPAVDVPEPIRPEPVKPAVPPALPDPAQPVPAVPASFPCASALLPVGMIAALGLASTRKG
jgi:Ca-activated chloride channel family protein